MKVGMGLHAYSSRMYLSLKQNYQKKILFLKIRIYYAVMLVIISI